MHGPEDDKPQGIIRKDRLDALTDGVFAFAMTLLVINLDLPDSFNPKSGTELLDALRELDTPLIAYVISFAVLAVRWIGQAQIRPAPETVSGELVWWQLAHLFFITLVPFTTKVVGRYEFPPAVWLYGANMALAALVSIRISYLLDREAGAAPEDSGRLDLVVLAGSAILSIILSFTGAGTHALWAYALNALKPIFPRGWNRI